MAIRIPTYESQVATPLQPSGAATPLTTVQNSTGAALQQLGAATTQIASVVHEQDDQDQQAALSRQIGDDQVKWLQYSQQAKDAAAPGAPNFTPDLLTNFDDYANESLSKMQPGRYRDLYSIKLNQLRTSLATNAVTWQAEQHRAYNVDQYSQGNDSAARVVAMDPSQYGQQRATQLALIDTSSLDAATKAKLSDSFKDLASTAAGMRMTSDNPAAAYAALTQSPDKPLPPGYDWIGDLPPQKLSVLQNHAQTLLLQQQNAADAAALQRENQGVTAFNQALDLVNQGKQLSPDYQTQLLTTTNGTSVAAQAGALIKQAAANAGFSSFSLAKQAAAIQADQSAAATPGVGTDPTTAAAVKQRQQIYTASVQAYKTDPWNAALDRGVITNVPAVDTSTLAGLTQSLAARAATAPAVEDAAGRRVSLLTPDESQAALRIVQSLPIDTQAQALNGIGGAMGNAARINDLAQQWKEKSPAIALALKAGAGGGNGNPLMTVSGQPVSAFILSGQQAIADKTVKVDDTVSTGMKAQIANAVDGSLPPQQADDAKESAYYIAIGSAARNGRATPSTTDIQNGIAAATGGISTTGGVMTTGPNRGNPNRVAMPYGWNEGDFQNSVKTAGVGNIENTVGGQPIDTVYANGTAIPVGDFMTKFPSYQLVRVGVRGTYAVQAGAKFVTDRTGAPVTVHLTLGQKSSPTTTASPDAPASDVIPSPY